MNLGNFSIRHKLTTAFAVLAGIVLCVCGLAINALSVEHHAFSSYVNENAARLALANEMLDAANARAIHARNLVLVTTAQDRAVEKAAVNAAHQKVGASLAKLKAWKTWSLAMARWPLRSSSWRSTTSTRKRPRR